jgi:hypothetical protein
MLVLLELNVFVEFRAAAFALRDEVEADKNYKKIKE